MKIKRTLLALLLIVLICQCSVFAAGNVTATFPGINKQNNKECKDGCKHSNRFTFAAINILVNKYDVKTADIDKAKAEGKTIFDVAKTKGLTEVQIKELIITPKIKAIDEMILTGELTKEKGELIKTNLKASIDKWDGKITDLKDHDNKHNESKN